MNFATASIGGNIGKDPETRQAGQGQVTSFSVAVNDRDDNTTWFQCSAWGKLGETIAQYFGKGDQIVVWGTLKLDQWEGQDGSPKSTLKLNVQGFSFAGGRKQDDSEPVNHSAGRKRSGARSQPADNYGDPVSSDDIPF